MRILRPLLAVLACLAVVAGCSGAGNSGSTGGYVSSDGTVTVVDPDDREKLPELSGTDLDGDPLSTDDFTGTVMVINVWGSWCPPCRAEAPVLKELSDAYADDVQFLGIVNRSKDAAAEAFNQTYGITYPSFSDEGGGLELRFVDSLPSQAIPTTWVIDAEGRVAARILDEVDASTLGGIIDDLLAESGAEGGS
ncbi:MAG: TlpA disulfide reductase family protein [Aeromicrobium sp.]|uniref:TlpA family protein disulfide reductase n=1 Tax=Aeromicrobium sp. TaxID=1871063 RepID=UPI0025BA72DE|nr:TlpA disulfide reductase family protein [Aeromicrobium sp.]MCK5892048.1 TlpA family protein disulfide reductase [Aeromicrobium sp.]MDF1704293.1 TlpA disulfide reductase family protein [Aeromicrobium sp.]